MGRVTREAERKESRREKIGMGIGMEQDLRPSRAGDLVYAQPSPVTGPLAPHRTPQYCCRSWGGGKDTALPLQNVSEPKQERGQSAALQELTHGGASSSIMELIPSSTDA